MAKRIGWNRGKWVIEHGENALALVRNSPFVYGGRIMHQDTHPVRLGTAGKVAADLRPSSGEAHFASPVKAHRNWYLRHSGSPNVDPDDEVDMAADTSIPMDEDKVGPHPSFGSNNTFDPRLAYQPPPYNHDTNVGIDALSNNGGGEA